MKKILFFAAICLIAAGCENKYTLVITMQSESSGITETEPEIIRAKTDYAAYAEALSKFDIRKDVASMMEGSAGKYTSYPRSFTLTDSKGDIVYFPDMKSSMQEWFESKHAENQKKAFAGAEFGMTIEQVKTIAPFNDSDAWHDGNNYLYCFNYLLGDKNYKIGLVFDNDELYRVTFSSKYYRSATYLDTSIKEDVENFKNIIQETYDRPTNTYGFPSILRLEAGYILWAYKWEIGTKDISVGVEEKSSGSEYQMFAEIIDTKRNEAIKAKREEVRTTTTKDAATQF